MFMPDPANASGPPLIAYIHADHLNAPRVLVDTSNRVRWHWLAEPFGTTAPANNPSGLGVFTQNLRFPGQYADAESGLFYNYFRQFDPSRGYVQSDPIGLAGGVSAYSYVQNNPLSWVDPNGLWATDAHGAIIDAAFPGLSPLLLAKIKGGSEAVDGLANQLGDGSYMHAMRGPGESIENARGRACEFIRRNLATYNALKDSAVAKNRLSAYYSLGQALHPIMDSTSPQHRGFQVWDPRAGDVLNRQSQPYQHGNNSPEDLAHLTPELKGLTVQKILDAIKSGNCSCLN
ncbi:RHS repeat-associated core domain-containing protein [Rhizobacter sp. Root1238]|uniref:RHS repeat domain-containing protein n=3 Tax=unclassified Rhizobacter TaxID=2640088 RepID=UPI0019109CF4